METMAAPTVSFVFQYMCIPEKCFERSLWVCTVVSRYMLQSEKTVIDC